MGQYSFGRGTLYVDGQPYAGVRDLHVSIEGREPDPFVAGPPSRGRAEVIFDPASIDFGARWSLEDQIAKRMVEAMRAAIEAEVRHMLGQWVSELEPCLMQGPGGEILGLGVAGAIWGDIRPVIRARPIVVGRSECRRCGSHYFSAGVNIDPTRCPRCG